MVSAWRPRSAEVGSDHLEITDRAWQVADLDASPRGGAARVEVGRIERGEAGANLRRALTIATREPLFGDRVQIGAGIDQHALPAAISPACIKACSSSGRILMIFL